MSNQNEKPAISITTLADGLDEWARSTEFTRTAKNPVDVGDQMALRDAHELLVSYDKTARGYEAIADLALKRIQLAIDAIGKERLSDEGGVVALHKAIENLIAELDDTQAERARYRADVERMLLALEEMRKERDELRGQMVLSETQRLQQISELNDVILERDELSAERRNILQITKERDELSAKVKNLETNLQTEGFRADGCQAGMDSARMERDQLRKDLCEIADGCGVGCPDISEAKRRIIAIRADRDEWKRRHDNAAAMLHSSEEERTENRKHISALQSQLDRICKEGFSYDDTIGGEPADDYVLRQIGKLNADSSRLHALLRRGICFRGADEFDPSWKVGSETEWLYESQDARSVIDEALKGDK